MTGRAPSKRRKGRVDNAIRALRAERGMTQQRLADIAGATRQTIIAVEAGKYAPSLQLAFKIARAFDVPFDRVWTFNADG